MPSLGLQKCCSWEAEQVNSWKIFYQEGIQLEMVIIGTKVSYILTGEKSLLHPFNKAGNINGSLSILSMTDPYKTRL